MTFFLLILLGMYVFKFAAFASVKRSPFEATFTAFLNGMDCSKNVLDVDCQTQSRLKLVIELYLHVSHHINTVHCHKNGVFGPFYFMKIYGRRKCMRGCSLSEAVTHSATAGTLLNGLHTINCGQE
jgi:hypothetical protein